jgi:hypothetical protein
MKSGVSACEDGYEVEENESYKKDKNCNTSKLRQSLTTLRTTLQ